MSAKVERRVLYEEKAARVRFRKALMLPFLFFSVMSLVVELSFSIDCSHAICELRRSSIFTDRVVATFNRHKVMGITCLNRERLEDSCTLKILLEEDTVTVHNFKNGSEAFAVAELLNRLTNSRHETFCHTHHCWWLGRVAEGMSFLRKVSALCISIALSSLCVGCVIPYKRLWVLEKGMLLGIDHFLHTTALWNNSFWTLSKYSASLAWKEVTNRVNLTYAIYWIELADGSIRAKLGEPSRCEDDIAAYLTILKEEIETQRKKSS